MIASYLGWTLDAFDFFVLVFVLTDVSPGQFHVGITAVALALTLTLAFRPLGAFMFGRLADRYGRRPVLMVNIALYSLFGFLTAFAPSLIAFPGDPLPVRRGDGRGVGHRRVARLRNHRRAKSAALSPA